MVIIATMTATRVITSVKPNVINLSLFRLQAGSYTSNVSYQSFVGACLQAKRLYLHPV